MEIRGLQSHIDRLSAAAHVHAEREGLYAAHTAGAGCSVEGAQGARERFLEVRRPRDAAAVQLAVTYLAVQGTLAEMYGRRA